MMQLAAFLAAIALGAAGPAAAASVVSMPLVLQAEHQNVTATVEQGGAAVGVFC